MTSSSSSTTSSTLILQRTPKFSILSPPKQNNNNNIPSLPIINVMDLLKAAAAAHRKTNQQQSQQISTTLWSHLETHGYVFLTSTTPEINKIITSLKDVLSNTFFVANEKNGDHLQSGYTYLSERGVPMWRLGYELCDSIREMYRVHAGEPDSQPWPSSNARRDWLRAMCFCRHVCDAALSLTLDNDVTKRQRRRRRAGSGFKSWMSIPSNHVTKQSYYELDEHHLPDRPGDYSVMYAMHYFNSDNDNNDDDDNDDDNPKLNVKEHVDPSLFVLEPFQSDVEGLQVKDSSTDMWITCDGPVSPLVEDEAMVLFVGKAFAEQSLQTKHKNIKPTLHRVIASNKCQVRRTVIYEQKYEEYFPPPIMD